MPWTSAARGIGRLRGPGDKGDWPRQNKRVKGGVAAVMKTWGRSTWIYRRQGTSIGLAQGEARCDVCSAEATRGQRALKLLLLVNNGGNHALHTNKIPDTPRRSSPPAPLCCPVRECGARHKLGFVLEHVVTEADTQSHSRLAYR